jgi:hypothetical protein
MELPPPVTGEGTQNFPNGNSYAGHFDQSVFDGFGTYLWKVEGDKYEGEWSAGKRQGQGKFTWADGSVYDGPWKKDAPHTQNSQVGIWTQPGGEAATGQWSNGKLELPQPRDLKTAK